MLAAERLLQIQDAFGEHLVRITPLDLDGETLRAILYVKGGTSLRVTEQWEGQVLKRYSTYWLSGQNELKTGWDNSAHHMRLTTFPHHKHVGQQDNLQPSQERCLEDVMAIVLRESRKARSEASCANST